MFNKKLKEINKNLEKQINDVLNLSLKTLRALEIAERERGKLIEEHKKTSEEIGKLLEFKRKLEKGGFILKKWLEYSVLPQSCDSTLELTDSGFEITFSPNNFNPEKFPEMVFSVFQGDYNLQCKVEINTLNENRIMLDIFTHLLKNHKKLGSHTLVWDKTIEIFDKAYSSPEIRTFLEDIVKVYREARSQYWKLILPETKKE